MDMTPEITAWIERENEKNKEFIQWLPNKLQLGLFTANIQMATDELQKAKNSNAPTAMIKSLGAVAVKRKVELREALANELNLKGESYFNRIKSRWSSHINRQNNKNISCSISQDAYKKLAAIKGKHKLKDTLEIMIAYIYEGQTERPLTDINNPKTKPLLDTIPNTKFAELGITLEHAQAFISNQDKFSTLQNVASIQRESIAKLQKIIETHKKE